MIAASEATGNPAVLTEAARALSASHGVDPSVHAEWAIPIPIAEAHLRQGQHEAVIALLSRHLKTPPVSAPRRADAHAIVAIANGSTQRPAEALRHFERALALNPKHEVATRNIATARAAWRGPTP